MGKRVNRKNPARKSLPQQTSYRVPQQFALYLLQNIHWPWMATITSTFYPRLFANLLLIYDLSTQKSKGPRTNPFVYKYANRIYKF